MRPDTRRGLIAASSCLSAALAAALALGACASPAPPPPEVRIVVEHPPLPVPPPAPAPAPAPVAEAVDVLAYADRVRALAPNDLAQEVARFGEPPEAPAQALQQAVALAQTRVAANTARAQSLVQRVLSQTTPQAQALHPLARLLGAQINQQAEGRRLEEQVERQSQQLRDSQRRIEVLNDRLEAVRAIERSLPSRPASAPANGSKP